MYQIDEKEIKKAYLVCPYDKNVNAEYSSTELRLLAESDYYEIVKINIFVPRELNARTYFGIGKAEEIRDEIKELGATTVIIDCKLSGSQLRNLAEIFGVETIDRTMLILDIFAGRAKSREGKLQVELAKLKYSLPRLSYLGLAQEKMQGKGAGESLKDLSKRKIQDDIIKLEKEIKVIQKNRDIQRKQRVYGAKSVALVGYTNAGKSTLMNVLSKAGTYSDDRLFATLDVLTKKIWDCGEEYVLTDTVGFVSNLPHELMYAFSATLEETLNANVLLLVVDSCDEHKYEQIEVVLKEIRRLNISDDRVVLVYNKVDKLISESDEQLKQYPFTTCKISAKKNQNIDGLKKVIREKLAQNKYWCSKSGIVESIFLNII